ncbi:protein SIEVE ELEMENT OCCLUSION B-like [Primulina huaijiensis]|uniref:protein SIEVE ELEMENT OCCLUSION B-like n=1 Tax=Primulina huaijiensis TaxID=1492673 RepID=UPI003CC7787E
MASRDVFPSTKNVTFAPEKVPPTKAQIFNGGVQDYETDQRLRPSYEMEHNIVKPLPLGVPAPGRGQLVKGGGGRVFFSADDTALTKQILGTHSPEIEDFDVKPVLFIVEDIIHLAKPLTADSAAVAPIQAHLDTLDNKVISSSYHDTVTQSSYHDAITQSSYHDTEIVKLMAFPINKISNEIICKCTSGTEAHSLTMDLLKSLSNYPWDAKVVITFAAFSINYGEFWLVEQLHTKNPLAKNVATLKDLPSPMEHSSDLRKKFEAVVDLLTATTKMIHCIIEFKELPSLYISRESPEVETATAHIPIAVYWIIRSLLASASVLLNLIGTGHEYISSTAESWEISSLAHKLSVMLEHLQKQLQICKELIVRKKSEDSYTAFKKLMETAHIDNMKVLKGMIRAPDEQRPLYDGSKRYNERIDGLKAKYVLLLISDLDLPHEELNILHMIYNQQQMRHEYEVLWLPIVNRTNSLSQSQELQFKELKIYSMPWYSVDHPSLIEQVAIRYIQEVWKFVHMPMLVVLDPQGKPSNLDALPMMWIWGSLAFPFTKARETALWSENTWNIELLADSIDQRIPDWIRDNSVICLYGGEDIDWIRKFTVSTRAVASALNVPLEMLYVGKRNPKDKVRRCHEVIDREKLSHIFSLKEYYDYVWYFWVRLWSMWNSKKNTALNVDNDHVMQQIMEVLSFDSSDEGWAVFSRGNNEMTKGKGDILLPVLDDYNSWRYKVDHPDKFVTVLDEAIRGIHREHHCNRLILPGHAGYIPEQVVCSECGKIMDKYVMYRCCTD